MIWLVLFFALVLRLINLNQSIWLDEAINIVNAKNLDFLSFISKYPLGDFHPPGYFALLWAWIRLFGTSEIAVRVPSVILGVGSVWLTYLLGKDLFNKKVALLSAVFLSVGPLHVYYSQEARMYSLAVFSAVLSFYFLTKLVKENKKYAVAYMLSLVLVFYSDYLIFLIIPSQLIYIIFFEKKFIKLIISANIFALFSLLPWLTVFPNQLKTGQNAASDLKGWVEVVGGANLKEVGLVFIKTIIGRVSFFNKYIYGFVTLLSSIFYGLILYFSLKKLDKSTKLLLLWLFVPLIFAFIISFFIPVLTYFRMIFILPAFYILLAKGIDTLPQKYIKVTTFILVIISLTSLLAYYINPSFQREDWRVAVKKVEQLVGYDGVVIFENNNLPAPYIYYNKGTKNAIAGLKKVPVNNINEVVDLEAHTLNKRNVYVFEYLVEINDPNRLLEKKLESLNFKKTQTLNFSGVGFVNLYTRL